MIDFFIRLFARLQFDQPIFSFIYKVNEKENFYMHLKVNPSIITDSSFQVWSIVWMRFARLKKRVLVLSALAVISFLRLFFESFWNETTFDAIIFKSIPILRLWITS